ncbi:hypothetical protein RIF29_15052 [Crotalaria pallida]|uniref:Uncharacterized protein n=1 Tax=Crotalaria pallida TaxID=3830 RepID=A0AAN9IAW2_CROPI
MKSNLSLISTSLLSMLALNNLFSSDKEPLEDKLEAVPQSDQDEVEEDPSEGSTPVEYSDVDTWEYDPEEVPAATSSDED